MSLSEIAEGEMALLTAREAAKYLNVSLATLYRIEKRGDLIPFRTSGGHRRYSLAMLNEYLERSRQRSFSTSPSRKGRRGNPKVRILVVSDEPNTVELIAKALREDRDIYQFAAASSSYDVGVRVAAFRPTLVLLDMARRENNGCEICMRIKSDPDTKCIKVVGLVNPGEDEIIEELLSCGVDDCLIKPLQADELRQSVRGLTSDYLSELTQLAGREG